MLDTTHAVEILRKLRAQTAVATPIGQGIVWCQVAGKVTVLVGRTVAVFYRDEVEAVSL